MAAFLLNEPGYNERSSSNDPIVAIDLIGKSILKLFVAKKPLHLREIQWDIYNTYSLKFNGFFREYSYKCLVVHLQNK